MSIILVIIIAVTIGVAGQLFIKIGINSITNLDFCTQFLTSFYRIFFAPFVIIGILIYFSSTFFWLYAISKVDLSFAYPFLALSYVLIVFASQCFLGENVSFLRWVGVCVICFGVFLISKS